MKTEECSYVMTEHIPRALFGTFWIHSPTKELNHVSSYNDLVNTKSENVALNFMELIQANKGKKMKVHIGKEEIHEGVPEEVIVKDAKGKEKSIVNNNLIVFKTATDGLLFSFGNKKNRILRKAQSIIRKRNDNE